MICLEGDRQASSHKSLYIMSHLFISHRGSGQLQRRWKILWSRAKRDFSGPGHFNRLRPLDGVFLRGEETSTIDIGEKNKMTGPFTVEPRASVVL